MRLKRICKHAWKRLVAMTLVIAMLNTSVGPVSVQAEDIGETGVDDPQTVTLYTDDANGNTGNTDGNEEPGEESGDAADTSGSAGDTETKEQENVPAEQNVYDSGLIRIYNLEQLEAVGTGAQVYSGDDSADTFGTGDAVTDENGSAVVYGNDAAYMLMNEISLDSSDLWQLPAGFAGSFTGTGGNAGSPLYDAETDTIYIYNNYQLGTANDPEALKTVMSNDMIAEEFGMGQIVFADEAEETQLEYTDAHNYVLTTDFTSEMPELKAETLVEIANDGREYAGQVIYHDEDGTEYILIGSRQQLEIIGKTDSSNEPYKVTEPIWKMTWKTEPWNQNFDSVKGAEIYYPGDADLVGEEYADLDLYSVSNGLTGDWGKKLGHSDWESYDAGAGVTTYSTYVGSMLDEKGQLTYNKDAESNNINIEEVDQTNPPRYSTWANYIIFRNIDLDNFDRETTWKPLMFSGSMEGRLNMAEGQNITISNINVEPETTHEREGLTRKEVLNTSENVGIGFFGTITNELSVSESVKEGMSSITSGEPTIVKNITLSGVTVTNDMTEAAEGATVVGGLLDIVGGLLGVVGGLLDLVIGGIVGGLLDFILGTDDLLGDFSTKELLTGLLDIRKASPDSLATGGFAGRIIGNVEVSGCHVTGLTVSNAANVTGGFVGNVEGLTEYDILSSVLGDTVEVLEGLLNVIPGLGLGDVITLLLGEEGLLSAGQLIPIKYIPAKITDCSVSVSQVGSESGKYAGGFAGVQTGSEITGCNVYDLESVSASKYAGGFTGVTRDAIVQGLLNDLGLELADLNPVSVVKSCSVNGKELAVKSNEKYAGGFTGLAANSDIFDSSVTGLISVTAADKYAGGFAGRATLGAGVIMAGQDEGDISDKGLLGSVSGLLSSILTSGNADADLLSLIGVSSSKLDNCDVTGATTDEAAGFTVQAVNYAGGLVGRGDGLEVAGTAGASEIRNISKVTATDSLAGGVAGQLLPANGGGILDSTVTVANVLSFSLDNVSLAGGSDGLTVTAGKNYAGGAVGQAAGGTINNVKLTDLAKVSADNYAGGFIALASPGDLVEVGDGAKGLDILGLVEIGDLLSVAAVIHTKIADCSVAGKGLVVEATGEEASKTYFAGGFVGENSSSEISKSSVTGLKKVSAKTKTTTGEVLTSTYAGGFAAQSQVGGLAEVGDSNTIDQIFGEGILGAIFGGKPLVGLDGLLSAVGYMIPDYTDCYVQFSDSDGTEAQVDAAVAGGFIGEMQGGKIDNTNSGSEYAVRNIKNVHANYYAGGFAGRIYAGGLAESDGLSLLGMKVTAGDILNLIPTYIPKVSHAGVSSEASVSEGQTQADANPVGLTVTASETSSTDADAGSAGGYVGLSMGARIDNSDVNKLATKESTGEPGDSDYAVEAPVYAGGFVGKAEIGSAAAVGGGLNVLGAINIENLTGAVAAVESQFDSSDVYGMPGGFNVRSTAGSAGGYAGTVNGSRFNDCDSYNFEYIVGVVSAGGYAGTLQPGDVANIAGSADVLSGLVSADNLLTLARTFIPRVWNSETTAVPCGGYVKATGESGDGVLRGLAGGYAGYNLGGQIIGHEKEKSAGTGEKTASAIRIRSVIGQEYAGGFTGLMQAANLADTGSLKLLWGLVTVNNLLSAGQAVYPTETDTKVTGPLRDINYEDWKAWVEAVGSGGAYGDQFENANVSDQDELNAFLEDYIYGYEVEALAKDEGTGINDGGSAGGYVGRMEGGIITQANALDVMSVEAYRSAGGFAGEMITGTLANLGEIDLAELDIVNNLGLVSTFVPVIYGSQVQGYQSGMTVEATADNNNTAFGNAGGFAGIVSGGQIWDLAKAEANSITLTGPDKLDKAAKVSNVKSVTSNRFAGGFAGVMDSASALEADVESESGLLNQILGLIISGKEIDSLVSVLNATLPTVGSAEVNGQNLVVNAENGEAAGGFVGKAQGAIIGERDSAEITTTVNNLKAVTGCNYAGGFFGLSDVAGVAEVADENTSILGILGVTDVNVLSAFRTYIYSASVNGVENGFYVTAKEETEPVEGQSEVYNNGTAGGFGGSLLDSTVLNSQVNNLAGVSGKTYTGGFVGLTGKSGVVDVDNVSVFEELLGASAGVLDVFGSQIENSRVAGIASGYTVSSSGGSEEIAGGFVGYGDLARIDTCQADKLEQVYSDETAGGFIGKTSYAYLVEGAGESALLNPILYVVNELLQILYLEDLQDIDLINVELPAPFNKVLELKVLSDDSVLSVTLLGLKISVGLVQSQEEGVSDLAQIYIGDSYIELKCHEPGADGNALDDGAEDSIKIGLIKANRTKVADSKVTGIESGYDVFGGGAGNDKDGSGDDGYAGGFVGYNDEGLLENNTMDLADTIRGTEDRIGAFSGTSSLKSVYEFNTLKGIEGENNTYHVYRKWDDGKLTHIYNNSNVLSSNGAKKEIGGISYYDYSVQHMQYANMYKHNDVWNGAYQTTEKNIARFPVNVYVSGDQADLMLGTPTYANESDIEDIESEMQDPCAAEGDHTFQKVWVDDGNSGETRPDSISVTLRPEGTPTGNADDIQIPMDSSMAGSDKDVWTTSVDAPINYKDADGTIHKYDYTVTEVPIKDGSGDQTYATIYKDVDEYTHQIINYLPTELIREDTVVIDYGLSVDIDVLTNDKAAEIDGAKLAGVAISNGETAVKPELINKVTNTLDKSFTAANSEEKALTGTYGTAYIKAGENGAADEIRFTPDTMEMDSCQQIMYAVQLPDNNGQDQYVYGMVTVVPATTIYFEDNFGAIHYTNGNISDEVTGENYTNYTEDEDWENHGIWKIAGNGEQSDVQDTDRPGESEIKAALDNVYGNDTHYENCQTYSNGTSHKTRVSQVNYPRIGGTYPKATFEFKGTGFDVISVTSGDTGAVEVVVKDSGGNELYDDIINTYYGYTGTIEPDQTSEDVLYQIPVLKKEGLPYDKYTVEIIPVYSTFNDMNKDTYYDIYFDAVRIYDPASAAEEDYQIIEEAYNKDKENNPEYMELRDIMLNADNVTGVIQGGTVFIDGNSTLDDIKDYEDLGPKNEIYLKPGQAISFYLWASEIPDTVQISAKVALGSSTDLSIATAVNEKAETDSEDAWEYYKNRNVQINTSYDLYYDISENCEWIEADAPAQAADEGSDTVTYQYRTRYPIVIKNPAAETDGQGNGTTEEQSVLSLTNLKWTGTVKPMGNQPGTEDGTAPGQDDDPTPNTGTEGQDPSEGNSGIQTRMAKAGARTMPVMAAEDTQDSITLMASVAPENIPAAYYFINQSETPGEGEEGGGQTTPGEGEEGGSQTTPGEGEEGGSQTTPETGDNNAQQKPAGQAPGNNEDSAGDPADKTPDQSGYSAVQTGDMVAAAGFAVLFAMMALSAIAASAAVYYRRKHR